MVGDVLYHRVTGRAARQEQVSLREIRHMSVPIRPIRRAGSWGYLAGSWREAQFYYYFDKYYRKLNN